MTTPQHPYTNPLPYTLTAWRECVIWCACEDGGWRECVAQVYGALAVHEALDDDRCPTITHIPTGKCVFRAHGEHRVSACQDYAVRLTALGDWNTRAAWRLKALREAM